MDRQPVTECDSVINAVRDVDDDHPRLPLGRQQILTRQFTGRVIERRERIIHQERMPFHRQGADDRYALLAPPANSYGERSANAPSFIRSSSADWRSRARG
jgi:hypothetical protein